MRSRVGGLVVALGSVLLPCLSHGQTYSKTETIGYSDNLSSWVLGQVNRTATNGVEVSRTDYDATTALPMATYRFGKLQQSMTYNADGTLAMLTDGNNNVTRLGNYKRGIPQLIQFPATPDQRSGTSMTTVVDDLGDIRSVVDAKGAKTCYDYDAMGRVQRIQYPSETTVGQCGGSWSDALISFSSGYPAAYGLPAGHWRQRVAVGNRMTETFFDSFWRPVIKRTYDVTNVIATMTQVVLHYDVNGNTAFVSYPQSTVDSAVTNTWADPTQMPNATGTTTLYDGLNRVTSATQSAESGVQATTTTQYLSGFRTQITDPNHNVTTIGYMAYDQPVTDWPVSIAAPEGITQTITRDPFGTPLSLTQSGLYNGTENDSVTKTMVYDPYHRLCRTTEPESGDRVMAYDDADNLAWSAQVLSISGAGCGTEQVAAAAKTSFGYDPMNRLKSIAPPGGTQTQSTAYTYDAQGNPLRVVSGTTVWNSHFNFRNMLTAESLNVIGQPAVMLGYAHDANGSVSALTYPNGETVSYAPDALSRPTQVGSYVSGIAYAPNGSVASFTYGNGTVYVAALNTRQLPSNFTYGHASTLNLSEDFSYDNNGNILGVQDLVNGQRSRTFGYDGLNRLSSAVAPALWGTESYTYDALNNLRTRLFGGQTTVYHYDLTNRLASLSKGGSTVSSFGYDPRGNLINRNGVTLQFDQKNQLSQMFGFDSYAYDANGRRVSKTAASGGASTYYFYDYAGQLAYQYAPGSAQATNFIYLGSKLIARNVSLQLTAPGAVSFDANPNNGNYTVSWGAVLSATSYNLQENAIGGSWVTVYTGSAPSITLSNRAGGSYVYQVQGCNGSICGGWTGSVTLGVRPVRSTVTVPGGTINGSYNVSWTVSASATAFDVQESLNGGAWSTIASGTPGTSISRPGTTSGSYTYQVSSSNSYGSRGWSGSGAVTVDTTYGVLPNAPASLSVPASSNNGSATLSWSATSLTTHYVVNQSADGGASWSALYDGAATSTALSGLADGSYGYRVQACNTYGCSGWTAGSTTLGVTYPPTTAPVVSTPASSANGSYTVNWSGVNGPVSYTLQEQVNGGGWTTLQSNGITSWSASGRVNGTYDYHVQACNVGGCGPWSTIASISVLWPPAVPGSISVPATSSGSIAISWAASSTASSYTLQQNFNGGGWASAYSGGATGTTRSVASSGSYSYQVNACNTGGCSGWRAGTAVSVTIPPASAPGLSVPGSSNTGSYTVSWSGVGGATSYILQEQINGGGWSTVQASGSTSWGASGKGNGSYGYHVQACNVGGCGPWGGVGTVAVTVGPVAPTTVTAPSYVHGVQYSVNWSASAGANSYNVQKTNYTLGSTVIVATTAATSAAMPAPDSSELLHYAVQACSAVGCSAFTNAPNGTRTDPPGVIQ
jgi:hypothetical protein